MSEDEGAQVADPDFGQDLYKKWFKSGERSGFLSLRPWLEAGKIAIDIGELNGGVLTSHTQVWANIMELATYLDAVRAGRATELYPASEKDGMPAEGFVYYGGSMMDQKPVSRIIKVHHWVAEYGDDGAPKRYDSRAFAWKTGHFEGKQSGTGAFIPNTSKPISVNLIKVSRREMAEIALRVSLTIQGFAARHDDWYQWKKK